MIAIKNADGTLVPVIDSISGANRSVALSLVHSHQKRAEILMYELEDPSQTEHVRDLPQPEPFGKLVLRHLPDNPFGEVEIQAALSIDQNMRLHISAEAAGEKPVKGDFRIPSAGLGQDERQNQMQNNDEAETVEATSENLFTNDIDPLFFPVPDFDEAVTFESEPEVIVKPVPAVADSPKEPTFELSPFEDSPSDAVPLSDFETEPLADAIPEFTETLESSTLAPSKADAFISDPEDLDWGFDELANPADANDAPGEVFEPVPTAKANSVAKVRHAPKIKPAAKVKSEKTLAAGMPTGQKLLRASAFLFFLSLVELGVYFLLQMHLL